MKMIYSQDELRKQWAQALALPESDRCVVFSNDGTVARLIRPVRPVFRTLGLHSGSMSMTEDFNDPLPEDVWNGSP